MVPPWPNGSTDQPDSGMMSRFVFSHWWPAIKEHKSDQLKIYEFKNKKEKQRSFPQYHYGNNRLFYYVDIVLTKAVGRLIFYEQLDESFEAFTGLIKRRGDTNLVQIKRINTSSIVKFVEWLRDRLLRIVRSCLRDTYRRVNKYF